MDPSDDMQNEVVRWYRAGLSGREIAKRIGAHPREVARALLRQNEPRRSRMEAVALWNAVNMGAASLSAEGVREIFQYDPETGRLTWAVDRCGRRVKAGDIAGHLRKGRWELLLCGKSLRAHRVIWLYMTGEWPKHDIDHINGDASDNRWANLRDVETRVNVENQRRPTAANSTGYLGVVPEGPRFRAQIKVRGRTYRLGTFDRAEDAHAAYVEAKRRMHEGCTL